GLIGFGLVDGLTLTLGFLVVAGVADVLAVVFRTSVIQLAVPDHLRGRTSATEFVVGAGAPQLGNFRAGLLGPGAPPRAAARAGRGRRGWATSGPACSARSPRPPPPRRSAGPAAWSAPD